MFLKAVSFKKVVSIVFKSHPVQSSVSNEWPTVSNPLRLFVEVQMRLSESRLWTLCASSREKMREKAISTEVRAPTNDSPPAILFKKMGDVKV